uniref:Uncharacterized protein n=1 Tax=Strongyloides papillosus TaxID=174720 RepID=A0A0N5C7U0_STREA
MILKNIIIIILFIILFNIIDVENRRSKRERPKLRVWGRIDCRNRHVKNMQIGLYQYSALRLLVRLQKVPCYCEQYFDIKTIETLFPKSRPFLVLKYFYTDGRLGCDTKAILKLPHPYDNNPYKFGKSYHMGTINILKLFYEYKKCHRIKNRRWFKPRKSE